MCVRASDSVGANEENPGGFFRAEEATAPETKGPDEKEAAEIRHGCRNLDGPRCNVSGPTTVTMRGTA